MKEEEINYSCEHCSKMNEDGKCLEHCKRGDKFVPFTRNIINILLLKQNLVRNYHDSRNQEDKILLLQLKGGYESLDLITKPYGEIPKDVQEEFDIALNNFSSAADLEKYELKLPFEQQNETLSPCNLNVCKSCKYRSQKKPVLCRYCENGNNYMSGLLSIETINAIFRSVNSRVGEGKINNEAMIALKGFTGALDWVIQSYTDEVGLAKLFGSDYISSEELTEMVEQDLGVYKILEDDLDDEKEEPEDSNGYWDSLEEKLANEERDAEYPTDDPNSLPYKFKECKTCAFWQSGSYYSESCFVCQEACNFAPKK